MLQQSTPMWGIGTGLTQARQIQNMTLALHAVIILYGEATMLLCSPHVCQICNNVSLCSPQVCQGAEEQGSRVHIWGFSSFQILDTCASHFPLPVYSMSPVPGPTFILGQSTCRYATDLAMPFRAGTMLRPLYTQTSDSELNRSFIQVTTHISSIPHLKGEPLKCTVHHFIFACPCISQSFRFNKQII